jgi:type VI secretion system protein ImpL
LLNIFLLSIGYSLFFFMSHGDQIKSLLGISALVSFYGIASLIVWFLGSKFGLGVTETVVLIALLLMTWPLIILFNYFRKRKAAQQEIAAASPASLPQANSNQLAQPSKGLNAPVGRYDELVTGTEETVQWLRNRLGGSNAGDAIYALPWFLVAGQQSSGKSSLLHSSGLNFHALPSQRSDEIQTIRPTRGTEWRVTDSAIFIDTAGRYQYEGADADEWSALVETIKKYRGVRPIDGLLITVNTGSILRANEAEIEQHAKVLRNRIDEVMQRTRVRFPVYLVFTHADAINGFRDFFANFDPSKRAGRVWGATIPLEHAVNAHALFDTEYDHLVDALMKRRMTRLDATIPPGQQLNIFDFPIHFNNARGKLGLFSSILFRPNPFTESPLMRGFYFTSSGSNGNSSVSGAYFAERFFKEVLLDDKDIASSLQAYQKRPSYWKHIVIGIVMLIMLFLACGMIVSSVRNRRLVEEALESGREMLEITVKNQGKDPLTLPPAEARVEIEKADQLRDILTRLDQYEQEGPPLSYRFGLYSGGSYSDPESVHARLRHIYFDSIFQRFYKPTLSAIEKDLQSFASGAAMASSTTVPASASTSDSSTFFSQEEVLGKHYDLLKAYLMLTDASKAEASFISNQLADYWETSAPPDMELVALQQLDFFSKQATREDVPRSKVNDELVSEVRRKLVAYPPVNRYYKRLTTEINTKINSVTLESILEGRSSGGLVGTYTVPGSFTINGYRNHITKAFESAAEEISKDDWVMGAAAANAKSQGDDVNKLQTMYMREYADHWRKFLKGITIREYNKKDEAVDTLKALSANDSPIDRIMDAVERHTKLSAEEEGTGLIAWIKSFFASGDKNSEGGNTEIEKEFRPVFQFVESKGKDDSSSIGEYRSILRTVADSLEGASSDQMAQTSKTLITGKDEIGLQKAELGVAKLLEGFKKTAAGSDAASLLTQPLGNLRAMLYGSIYAQLEKEWREQVYPKLREFETRYPFTNVTSEASVGEMSRFLNPANGAFTTFFNERLASSFEGQPGQLKLKEAGAFKFSEEFVKYINTILLLREAVFPNKGQQPSVDYGLTLQPLEGADAIVEIDGQRAEARGAVSSVGLKWPAAPGAQTMAVIKVVPADGQEVKPLQFTGEWALFKMFDAGGGERNKTPDGQYQLTWTVGTHQVKAMLKPSGPINPFNRAIFAGARAPQSPKK